MSTCTLVNTRGCKLDGKCHSTCKYFCRPKGNYPHLRQCNYPLDMLGSCKSPAFYNESTGSINMQGWFMYERWAGKLNDSRTNGIYFISEYTCMTNNKRTVTF